MKLMERAIRRLHRREILRQSDSMKRAPAQLEVNRLVADCSRVLDLGSGANPIAGATAAVDLFIDPRQRGESGGDIQPEALAGRGIRFVNQSIDQRLPFNDAEFEFAYCSHAIEHVEHPGKACDEMMRVSAGGLLRCPAAMAEFMLGREYHKWLVLHRAGVVLFIEKTKDEYLVFGQHVDRRQAVYNPFEGLLNWEGMQPWTPNSGLIGKLKRRIQALFYGRAPLMEVNLFWQGGFRWHEFRADGTTISGGRDGRQWYFDLHGDKQECGGGSHA